MHWADTDGTSRRGVCVYRVYRCERYGRHDLEHIALEVDTKTEEEVREYAATFWQRFQELVEFEKYIRNIERGEQKIQRYNDIMQALAAKLDRYKNPWKDLKIMYGPNKGKGFTEEEDRFMVCKTNKLGYVRRSSSLSHTLTLFPRPVTLPPHRVWCPLGRRALTMRLSECYGT
jgi:hypothetical protein